MSAVMAEPTVAQACECKEIVEIVLKPSKEYPRTLSIEWREHDAKVRLTSKNFQWLMFTRAEHSKISLAAQRMGSYGPLFTLRVPDSSFQLSQREFEILRAELEPRGVKVQLTEGEGS